MKLIFRIIYPVYRLSSALRYRAERRFTPAGLAVLGGLILSAMMGVDTDNAVTYQAFVLLLCLVLVALGGSGYFRARCAPTRRLPRFGTVGNPLTYSITVRNLTARPQRGLTLLEDLADPRPSFPEWLALQRAEERRARSFRFSQRRPPPARRALVKEASLPPILPRGSAEARIELTPLRRGVLRFAGMTLARSDPLGLVRAFVKVPLPQSLLVLPKRYPLPPIALPGTMKYQQGGVALAANVGRSEEFVALRDYREGDPLRHIHWRSWAMVGKPVVKEFEDEFFVRHALVLDTFTDHPQSEIFEEAVAVAASFACTLETQESLLDLLFVGPQAYCFTAGRGLAHADQMLEILASVRICHEQPFAELAHLLLQHVNVVSGCICVLLDWDEERRRLVAKLNALGVPVLTLVIVEPGQDKKLLPGPAADELGRFQVLEAGKIEAGLAKLV